MADETTMLVGLGVDMKLYYTTVDVDHDGPVEFVNPEDKDDRVGTTMSKIEDGLAGQFVAVMKVGEGADARGELERGFARIEDGEPADDVYDEMVVAMEKAKGGD